MAEIKHFGVLGMKWGVRKDRKKSKRQVRKENRAKVKNEAKRKVEEGKKKAQQLRQANEKRILSEISAYDKKTGNDFAKKFLETYDDLEMWDLYSPKKLAREGWGG